MWPNRGRDRLAGANRPVAQAASLLYRRLLTCVGSVWQRGVHACHSPACRLAAGETADKAVNAVKLSGSSLRPVAAAISQSFCEIFSEAFGVKIFPASYLRLL